MSEKISILEALECLELGNDSHWTKQGLPSIEVIHLLTEDKEITRMQVASVAPEFRRDNPILPNGVRLVVEPDTASAAMPLETAEGKPRDSSEESGDEIQALRRRIADRTERIDALERERIRMEQERESLETRVRMLTKHDKPDRHASQRAIQTYLESQKRLRRQQHEFSQAIQAEGRKFLASPLDQAMERPTGRKRPEFPQVG